MPITAEHLDAIRQAALPLAADRREAFTAAVTASLESVAEVGPGTIHRAIVAAQAVHFDPPHFNTILSAPRHQRSR